MHQFFLYFLWANVLNFGIRLPRRLLDVFFESQHLLLALVDHARDLLKKLVQLYSVDKPIIQGLLHFQQTLLISLKTNVIIKLLYAQFHLQVLHLELLHRFLEGLDIRLNQILEINYVLLGHTFGQLLSNVYYFSLHGQSLDIFLDVVYPNLRLQNFPIRLLQSIPKLGLQPRIYFHYHLWQIVAFVIHFLKVLLCFDFLCLHCGSDGLLLRIQLCNQILHTIQFFLKKCDVFAVGLIF